MLEGLLGFLPQLDEHKRMALLNAAAQMMQTRGNAGQQIGAGLQGGLMGYNTSRGLADRRAEEEQQRQMRAMQMEAMRGNLDQEKKIRALGPQFNMPGNLTPNDDEGNPMPAAPQGMNWGGYANALTGIDPMKGLALQSQLAQMNAKERGTLKPGETAGTWENGKFVPGYTAPKDNGPHPGQTREIKSGGNIHTYEWNGNGWQKIATAPQFKPEGPEKPEKPPQGYRYTADRSGLEPIPGGPADAKVGKEAEAQRKREDAALARADQVLGAVKQSVDQTGVMSAGPIGQLTRNIGGTPAFNLAKKVDEIKANIGFAELQAMREASPTGGALGQVAIQELQMLQSVLGSLDTAQSPDQLLGALYKVEKHYNNWKQTVKRARESQGGPKPGHVEDGYEYVGGPPGSPSSWRRK